MLEPPRRPQRLSVALPASFTRDIPHLREKTGRVGTIARALAIFRVDEVVVYNDGKDRISKQEGRLFEKRSEEHTSELQSHHDLVCRLLLEKKKKKNKKEKDI